MRPMEPSRERIVFVTMKLKPKFGWSRMPLPVAVLPAEMKFCTTQFVMVRPAATFNTIPL